PFTTSTLQQEANRKLKWTAQRTMRVAQRLYENGWITYMRTDATSLSEQAITAARGLIHAEYGDAYLPPKARLYKSTAKNTPKSHTTQPPPRLTEATLVKELEARGVGRPSTYASIIETILAREYVFKRQNALVPTFTAFAVTGLLEKHLAELVDYDFTAKIE